MYVHFYIERQWLHILQYSEPQLKYTIDNILTAWTAIIATQEMPVNGNSRFSKFKESPKMIAVIQETRIFAVSLL
jgi:hypothetical protein